MNNLSEALEYLNQDYLLNACVIEPILTDSAEVLYADRTCVMIKDKASEVYSLQTEDLALAEELIRRFPIKVLVAQNRKLSDFALERLGFSEPVPCYQGVYLGAPFEIQEDPDFSFRLMREEEADDATKMYHFDRESALKHIRLGYVYGGYDKEGIVGMIGMHLQGSMGLLYVQERARRKGYAEIMEKHLINSLLKRNLVPYCHVVEGNTASLSLQKKLGLSISSSMLYWLHKEA